MSTASKCIDAHTKMLQCLRYGLEAVHTRYCLQPLSLTYSCSICGWCAVADNTQQQEASDTSGNSWMPGWLKSRLPGTTFPGSSPELCYVASYAESAASKAKAAAVTDLFNPASLQICIHLMTCWLQGCWVAQQALRLKK